MVLMCLCDYANEEGHCWPSVSTIARKCSKGERTVQAALKWLEAEGFCTRHERAGTSTNYTVHPRKSCTPAKTAPPQLLPKPPQVLHPTPANLAPKPPMNHQEPSDQCATDVAPALKPEHIFERWNETAATLGKPRVRDLTPERRQLLKARIAQYALDDFLTVFGKIEGSAFLRGDTGWRGCAFDWVFKKANFQKILEGNYDE